MNAVLMEGGGKSIRSEDRRKHLFLTGEKQVGKTTLLQKLTGGFTGTIDGFVTVKTADVYNGRFSVHLLRVLNNETPSQDNVLFFCDEARTEETSRRFDRLGCAALSPHKAVDLIVMDELGPAEMRAKAFQAAVFQILAGDIPVIGVLQKAESAFLNCLKAYPGTTLVEVTKDNRDELASTWRAWLPAAVHRRSSKRAEEGYERANIL